MATNHTANYNLSQWEGSDAFSRLDFNADNLAVDTALKQLADAVSAMPLVKIKSVTASANAQTLSMDVSDVDFSDYLYVELILDIRVTSTSTVSHYLRLNNVSTSTYTVTTSVGNTGTSVNYLLINTTLSAASKSKVVRFMPYEASADISCQYMVDGGSNNPPCIVCCTASGVKWSELASFDYTATSSVKVKAGSGMYLYGVKRL